MVAFSRLAAEEEHPLPLATPTATSSPPSATSSLSAAADEAPSTLPSAEDAVYEGQLTYIHSGKGQQGVGCSSPLFSG
jgi:hypothetical protein